MEASWEALTAGKEVAASTVEVYGREVHVPLATADGVGRFDFGELCNTALGPADYLTIARTYHTLFVCGIPELNSQRRDQARRFISLVDALYECKTNLYCDAMAAPDNIFVDDIVPAGSYDAMLRESLGDMASEMGYGDKVFANQLFTGEEELFASERCVSRLMEMRGGMYRMAMHTPNMGFAGLDTDCLEFDAEWIGGSTGAAGVGAGGVSGATHAIGYDMASRGVVAGAAEGNGSRAHVAGADGADGGTDVDGRPKFKAKHFWGAGWWEKLLPGRKK
jgi:hypothetical protein